MGAGKQHLIPTAIQLLQRRHAVSEPFMDRVAVGIFIGPHHADAAVLGHNLHAHSRKTRQYIAHRPARRRLGQQCISDADIVFEIVNNAPAIQDSGCRKRHRVQMPSG